MEEILFWNNGLFRQPYWYIFLYSKLMAHHQFAGETDMTYDAAGNLLTKLTAELRKSISDKGYISYTYDFERLHEVLYPENLFNRVTYTYGKAGYGYIANDTTKEETFFYHSDHLGSTSYITDEHANITQYDAYLPYGELLVDERYQYNPQAKPGSEGGTLNPAKRKVTQKDIDHLKINKLKFRNGKAYIGHVSD